MDTGETELSLTGHFTHHTQATGVLPFSISHNSVWVDHSISMELVGSKRLMQGGRRRSEILAKAERHLERIFHRTGLIHVKHSNDLSVDKWQTMVLVLGLGLCWEWRIGPQGSRPFNCKFHFVSPAAHNRDVAALVVGKDHVPLVEPQRLVIEQDVDISSLCNTVLLLVHLMTDQELELGGQKLLQLLVIQPAGLWQSSVFKGCQQLKPLPPTHYTPNETNQSLSMV
mmetsp:Transcript_1828/g.3426  ORF Transcript_1828/g.3426 Transcript_1828/m.3426 type:complete len:227 (+) Transcript_1828:3935-4615(+)